MDYHDGFRELGDRECLRLLATASIGRIVFTHHALPAVLPVRYVLDHDSAIVVRTSKTSHMAVKVDDAIVSFEADCFDEDARSGWSVVVTGRAELVTDPVERRRLRALDVRSWGANPPEETYIRIACDLVAGRSLGRPPDADALPACPIG
ncbi:pyridoxamine 5'-phosphate oxidase family protein [Streptomyces sp. NBC_01477]|uniref:pyridoxamine 5'-phosphate oxidase family protein n=1 Tax=Streptomyces sp. NBC_01477 TaxID=2976015 RepID=UPI002E346117|nr:pyridoxamine 5'-phosphate oxidase family protein [Streptomyces sp. NBC_01477]